MTSVAEPAGRTKGDTRTIVIGGIKLGLATAVGAVIFALVSRQLAGPVEVVVQSLLIVLGGLVFAFAPAQWLRPRDVDDIAWAALIGLLGSVVFTVLDTAILRPVHLYHWTWDAIGGGSGFWYIPVWWMGSCFLAWLGAWAYSIMAGDSGASTGRVALQTAGLSVLVFAIMTATGIVPFHGAAAALAFAVALILTVPLASVLRSR